MAERAAADGIEVVVATPHWNLAAGPPSVQMIRQRCEQLQEAIDQRGLKLRLLPGAEVALSPDLLEIDDDNLPMLAGTRCLLVELLPYTDWEMARRVLFELQLRKFTVILAHPERAAPLHERYERAEELAASGIVMQVVASSLRGRVGLTARNLARRLVRDGLAGLLASDAHDCNALPLLLSPLRRIVERLGGRGTFDRLTHAAPRTLLGIEG